MAKKSKKKASKPAPDKAEFEKEGEEVVSEPAHVEEATICVRGTSVGGTKMMTPSEHEKYCAAEKKKVAK